MSRLPFTKMHGLGNDFLVIDAVTEPVTLKPEQIAKLADRRRGIGFDSLLMIAPPSTPDADFDYLVYNADGSQAEQCGNGSRCVALFVKRKALASKSTLTWQTISGPIETRLVSAGVEVTMAVPTTSATEVPFNPEQARIDESAAAPMLGVMNGSAEHELVPVSMGNPHGVLFVDKVLDYPVAEVGASLTQHPAFPEGANIGFCEVVDRNFIRLRVFERGVGETEACGSGACAAVVAGRLHGHLDERVKVSLPGGKVRIAWQGEGHPVIMTGPATVVYEGSVEI